MNREASRSPCSLVPDVDGERLEPPVASPVQQAEHDRRIDPTAKQDARLGSRLHTPLDGRLQRTEVSFPEGLQVDVRGPVWLPAPVSVHLHHRFPVLQKGSGGQHRDALNKVRGATG